MFEFNVTNFDIQATFDLNTSRLSDILYNLQQVVHSSPRMWRLRKVCYNLWARKTWSGLVANLKSWCLCFSPKDGKGLPRAVASCWLRLTKFEAERETHPPARVVLNWHLMSTAQNLKSTERMSWLQFGLQLNTALFALVFITFMRQWNTTNTHTGRCYQECSVTEEKMTLRSVDCWRVRNGPVRKRR